MTLSKSEFYFLFLSCLHPACRKLHPRVSPSSHFYFYFSLYLILLLIFAYFYFIWGFFCIFTPVLCCYTFLLFFYLFIFHFSWFSLNWSLIILLLSHAACPTLHPLLLLKCMPASSTRVDFLACWWVHFSRAPPAPARMKPLCLFRDLWMSRNKRGPCSFLVTGLVFLFF